MFEIGSRGNAYSSGRHRASCSGLPMDHAEPGSRINAASVVHFPGPPEHGPLPRKSASGIACPGYAQCWRGPQHRLYAGLRFCMNASMPSPASSLIMLQAITSLAYS